MSLFSKTINSPVGKLKVVASEKGLVAVLWENDNPRRVPLGGSRESEHDPILNETERQLTEYFAGRRNSFSLPLDMRGTRFQEGSVEGIAGYSIWGNEKLWPACQGIGKSARHKSSGRSKWKESLMYYRALSSGHWRRRATYRFCRRTKYKDPFAQAGAKGWKPS